MSSVPRTLAVIASSAASLAMIPSAGALPGAGVDAAPHGALAIAQTDRPLLQLGDTGASVAAWQHQLNLLSGPGTVDVDGLYSAAVERVTTNFQAFFGLRADGIVGENTRGLMRFLLASSRDYSSLFNYGDGVIVGYSDGQRYCFEVQAGDEFSVECSVQGDGPLSGSAIEVVGRTEPQLIGTIDPIIASVEVEAVGGTVPADIVRDVRGLDRAVWATPLAPSGVIAIRALAGDGSEVRRIVIDDGQAYLVLERGDRGPAVENWQTKLNEKGFDLVTDGVFGDRTVQATRAFQAYNGLLDDGIVGPQTRELMETVVK